MVEVGEWKARSTYLCRHTNTSARSPPSNLSHSLLVLRIRINACDAAARLQAWALGREWSQHTKPGRASIIENISRYCRQCPRVL